MKITKTGTLFNKSKNIVNQKKTLAQTRKEKINLAAGINSMGTCSRKFN